ncbi:class I SAM-dependent methyltransferase [Rhizobium sp. SJZ105]|uniref:class I SAM-dependent methyltransferase n=1 Tax=Rhizobium sp. SJZ105 TaxID=2572678 RepID=UPI0016451638|nr:class I SAM-dependent methyltransferase [Rhizobium sp. SJZ105]
MEEYIRHLATVRPVTLEALHKDRWRRATDTAIVAAGGADLTRYRREYLPVFNRVYRECEEFIRHCSPSHICEIGTGDGYLLAKLSKSFPEIDLTGIDISEHRVRLAQRRVPGLHFQLRSGQDWVEQDASENGCVIVNGGVFEYFSPESLRKLFSSIRARFDRFYIAIMLEPLYFEIDALPSSEGVAGGSEFSWSHNYAAVLEEEGFLVQSVRIDDFSDLYGFKTATVYAKL